MPLSLRRQRPPWAWRTLHLPPDLTAEVAADLLRQLAADKFVPLIAFEIEATAKERIYRIGTPAPAVDRIVNLFAAYVPDGAVTFSAERQIEGAAWQVKLSTRHRPVLSDAPERVTRALLAALNSCSKDESVTIQWLLGPARPPRAIHPKTPTAAVEPWWNGMFASDEPLDPERRAALASKRSEHAFACIGRVAIRCSSPSRTRAAAVSVLSGLKVAETPGLMVRMVKEPIASVANVVAPWRWPYTLNVRELVGLLAWPISSEPLPGIERGDSRWLRPDPRLRGHRRVLGVSTAPGEAREIGLSIEDARHHLHVLGPTGAGKSNLIGSLVLADAEAGRSVVVVDGKGDLVQDVLARLPEHRHDELVVIDAADGERPVGLNPLAKPGHDPAIVADGVLAAFHALSEGTWGPRLQVIFHAALLTLAGRRDSSLCALPALLTNSSVRRRLVGHVEDPVALEPFWAWFESISEAERQQAIAPVLSRLQPLLLRKSLRAIIGQIEPRFRIDEIFTKRRVVLVSLAKGLIGPEAAGLLGSLFVAELWQAVLERARVAPEKRHPVLVYADEFQEYVHLPTDMADALAQARGLGVGLTLAHQHLGQLPSSLKAAVLANARSRVVFQTSADDAQVMAKISGSVLTAEDFQRLKRFEAYAQIMEGGELLGPVSIRTLPLPEARHDPEALRALSRQRYGRPAGEVDGEIRKLIEGEPEPGETVGRRRRSAQ